MASVSFLTRLLCAATVALVVSAPAAMAAPTQNQRFILAGTLQGPALTVVGQGPVHGVGTFTAVSADYHQATDSYDETDRLAVGTGSLLLAIHGSFSTWPFTFDPVSCTQRGTIGGTWAVTSGDGSLAGATGQGTFSADFLTYAPRTPTGCDGTSVKGVVSGQMVGTVVLER
jgi:hypothetical protein